MDVRKSFFGKEESQTIDQFLEQGYVIFPIEELTILKEIRTWVYEWSIEILGLRERPSEEHFLDHVQDFVSLAGLNVFRLKLIERMAKAKQLRPAVYALARTRIGWIAGNELAMQRNCNISIQLPNDDSSLLPLHTDVWSGNSPYEIVFWFSLTDCYRTKSIFVLPKSSTDRILLNFKEYSQLSTGQLFQKIKNQLVWLEVPYGHGVIFSHILFHGGVVNEEKQARWSFNVRFKELLSPYAIKEIGESFLPITIRPVTRFGYNYKKPEVL